jgi:catabolite regulation protein CreA
MKLPALAARGHAAVVRAATTNVAALMLTAALTVAPLTPFTALPAHAESKRVIGEIQGSGLVFKDTLKVEAFDDPKVEGVQLYLSDFQRPVTEKLAKGDIFSDPSQGGLSCSHKGKVVVTKAASTALDGEEVFSESRSLIFKSLKVRRLVDREGESVVYAVFSQRLDKNEDSNNSRFKSNLCAVHVDTFE